MLRNDKKENKVREPSELHIIREDISQMGTKRRITRIGIMG